MSAAPETAPWYRNGLRFSCTQCGNCCGGAPGYVWVDARDVEQIAALLGMTPENVRRAYTHRVGPDRSLNERDDGDCVFLVRDDNGKTRCRIHPARPTQCRTWPFWQSNMTSPADWERSARECPGMNCGEHHPLPVIQQALRRNEEARLNL